MGEGLVFRFVGLGLRRRRGGERANPSSVRVQTISEPESGRAGVWGKEPGYIFFFFIAFGLEMGQTTSLRALNTSPPRNCFSSLRSSGTPEEYLALFDFSWHLRYKLLDVRGLVPNVKHPEV